MPFEKYNFSEDFQDGVIACVIHHPEKFDVFSELIQPELFNGVASVETVFRLKEYYNKYQQWPNFVTLGNFCFHKHARLNPDKARETAEYVAKLSQIDTGNNEGIFDMIRDFARERALYLAIRKAHLSLMENTEIEGGLIPMFEKALNIGSIGDDLGLLLQRDYRKIIQSYDTTSRGVGTGYEPLNNLWRAGWKAGWLIAIVAPPKRLKTTFCINLALNMSSFELGTDILYYACEIDQELAALRALCSISGYTMDDLYDKKEHFISAVDENIGHYVGNIFIKSYPSKSATIGQIKNHAKKVTKMYNLHPRAIFIDFAETVRPDVVNKDAPDWRQQADIYVQARALGSDLGCCVVMPDRVKAEFVERAVPNMKAFQGSFEKAGIVDIGIGLCQTDAEYLNNRMRYFVFLNRHGKAGKHYEGIVDPERYRMTITGEIPYVAEDGEFERRPSKHHRKHRQSKEMEEAAAMVQEELPNKE